jgi:hypothetical protein
MKEIRLLLIFVLLFVGCNYEDEAKSVCYRPYVCGTEVGQLMSVLKSIPKDRWEFSKWDIKDCFNISFKTKLWNKDQITLCEDGHAIYFMPETGERGFWFINNKLTRCCSKEIRKLFVKIKDAYENKQIKRFLNAEEVN